MIDIKDITTSVDWQHFVEIHPEASYFHDPSWPELFAVQKNVSIKCFGAYVDKQLVGILPLVVLRRTFGNLAGSLPIFNPGGPLLNHSLEIDLASGVIGSLLQTAENYLMQQKVMRFTLALHQRQPHQALIHKTLENLSYNVQPAIGYGLNLNNQDFESMQRLYHDGFRDGLRQGKKRGGQIIDGRKFAAEVFQIYRQTMQHADKFTAYDCDFVTRVIVSPACLTRVCLVDGRPIGFVCILGRQTNYVYWLGGMLREANEYRPMHLLMDEAIRLLSSQQRVYMDLGGAATPGLAYFKSSLGATVYEAYGWNKTLRPKLERRLFQLDHLIAKFGMPRLQRYV